MRRDRETIEADAADRHQPAATVRHQPAAVVEIAEVAEITGVLQPSPASRAVEARETDRNADVAQHRETAEVSGGSRRAAGALESAVLAVLWQANEPLSPGEVRERLARAGSGTTSGGTAGTTMAAGGKTAGGMAGTATTGGETTASGTTSDKTPASAASASTDTTSTAATGTTATATELSYSTVVTILTRLHDKHALTRERDGRAFRYAPVADEAGLAARRLTALLDRAPDRDAVLSRFVEDLSERDERLLRELLGGRADGAEAS